MGYEPMRYEPESLGDRVFTFTNDKHAGVEFVVSVDVLNTSQDSNVEDEAYEDLQAVFPNSWHDWRLVSKEDEF